MLCKVSQIKIKPSNIVANMKWKANIAHYLIINFNLLCKPRSTLSIHYVKVSSRQPVSKYLELKHKYFICLLKLVDCGSRVYQKINTRAVLELGVVAVLKLFHFSFASNMSCIIFEAKIFKIFIVCFYLHMHLFWSL